MVWKKSRATVSDTKALRSRLEKIFNKAQQGDLFTLEDLVDEVRAERKEVVAFLLSELASTNVVDQVVRVQSPSGGGIGDYASLNEVPTEMWDPVQRIEIEVDPSLIRVFFKKHAGDRKKPAYSVRSHALV